MTICECIAVPQRLLWSIRFKFTDKKNKWFYDISLVKEGEHQLFGIKIDTMFGADISELQNNLSLVETLINSKMLIQKRPIAENLWRIHTPEDAKKLVELLEDPRRTLPVIAVSAVNRNTWSFTPTAPEYIINASYLAEKVKGYAIVAQLTFQGAFAFTDLVGRSWSAYDGACRTYFPKVDFDNGIAAHHPCNFKDKIWFWIYDDKRGERGYTAFLINTLHRISASNRTDWRGLYFVPDARILSSELEMAHAAHLANAPERELAMQNHIIALQKKLQNAGKSLYLFTFEFDSCPSCRRSTAVIDIQTDDTFAVTDDKAGTVYFPNSRYSVRTGSNFLQSPVKAFPIISANSRHGIGIGFTQNSIQCKKSIFAGFVCC